MVTRDVGRCPQSNIQHSGSNVKNLQQVPKWGGRFQSLFKQRGYFLRSFDTPESIIHIDPHEENCRNFLCLRQKSMPSRYQIQKSFSVPPAPTTFRWFWSGCRAPRAWRVQGPFSLASPGPLDPGDSRARSLDGLKWVHGHWLIRLPAEILGLLTRHFQAVENFAVACYLTREQWTCLITYIQGPYLVSQLTTAIMLEFSPQGMV
jgi:hypothetical protein